MVKNSNDNKKEQREKPLYKKRILKNFYRDDADNDSDYVALADCDFAPDNKWAYKNGDAMGVSININYTLLGTTFAIRNTNNDIMVMRPYFSGTLQEFEKEVNETYKDDKLVRVYKALIELIKVHFEVF